MRRKARPRKPSKEGITSATKEEDWSFKQPLEPRKLAQAQDLKKTVVTEATETTRSKTLIIT